MVRMVLGNLRPVSGGVAITFYGVRGSTPCTGPEFARYGGHSSCVVLEADDQQPILFDLGTGLRPYGLSCQGEYHGTALLSHLHWDHMQGLPFFVPIHVPGATLDVYGPRQAEGALGDVFAQMMRPPFFPIRPADLGGEIRFHDTADDDFPVGLAEGPVAVGAPRGAHARLPRRVERDVHRLPARPRARNRGDRRRRLRPAGCARAL